jgi:hypothetical protein
MARSPTSPKIRRALGAHDGVDGLFNGFKLLVSDIQNPPYLLFPNIGKPVYQIRSLFNILFEWPIGGTRDSPPLSVGGD